MTGRAWHHQIDRAGAGMALVAALFTAGCTAVVSSTDWAASYNGRCGARLGAYKLSKTHLRILVTRIFNKAEPTKVFPYILQEIKFVPRADDRYSFCLDYLASPFAHDDVQVLKATVDNDISNVGTAGSNQLLRLITSLAVDKTAIVLRKLIRTIFIGLSQNADFAPARSLRSDFERDKKKLMQVTVADLEFDPFDPIEVADVNARLRRLGFCVVLEDYNFDRRRASVSRYCENPRRVVKSHPSIAAEIVAEQRRLAPREVQGVHYRPKTTYRLAIYVKDDPGGPSKWRLAKYQPVKLENISPVIALGVERAIFAERRTALVFDAGVLIQVCIAKGSEIEGFIDIPLDVVHGLVALPSQIIKVQIDSANLNAEVIRAENRVIRAQEQLIKLKTGDKSATPPKGLITEFQDPHTAETIKGDTNSVPFPKPAMSQTPEERLTAAASGFTTKPVTAISDITDKGNRLSSICEGVKGIETLEGTAL